MDLGRRKCERRVWRKARSGGQRTNLRRRRRRRYTTRSWLIPSSHVRVNGGVLVLTQRITARAIQKFTHCALNTISKFPPPSWPCLFPSSPKNPSFLPPFSPRFLKFSTKCRLCLREPTLYIYIYIYRDNNRCVQAKNFTENK